MPNNSNMKNKDELLPIIQGLIKKLPNIWVGYSLTAFLLVFSLAQSVYEISEQKGKNKNTA